MAAKRVVTTGGGGLASLAGGVELKSVPKDQIVERQFKGTNDNIVELKPTVQHPYEGPPRTALVITKAAWVAYEWLTGDVKLVLFTTPSTLEQMKERPKSIAAYLHIETFDELTSGMVEWKASKLHEKYNFTHVLAFAEEDLIRSGRIRATLGIKHGQSEESALRYRDKVLMKQILKDAGIKIPAFAPVESASDVVNFVAKHGINVVIKPRKGYSSVNTWIIHDEDKLSEFLSSGFNSSASGGFDAALDLDIEEFITGEMYHIDGFVYDNEVKVCWPSKYTNACSDWKSAEYLASYSLTTDNPLTQRLREVTVASVKALGGPSCFPFHAEFFVTPESELVFCEIASRTGGAGVRHQMFNLFNIIPDKTFAQWQAQDVITNEELGSAWSERPTMKKESIGWLFIYPSVGVVNKFPMECELDCCVMYKPFASVGDRFLDRSNCVDAVASIVYSGDTEEEMLKNVKALYDWFTSNIEYGSLNTL